MSEVLGDADPPARGRRPLDEDRPAFDDFGDNYVDFDDGFAAEPGPVRRFVAKVATAESLAIAAIVVATASLLDVPAIGYMVNSLAVSRQFDPAFSGRTEAAGQFVVAAISFALAIAARRRKPVADAADSPVASWAPMVSGGALIISAVSALLAIVSFLVAGTAHDPNANGLRPGNYVPTTVVTASPAPALDQISEAPLPGSDPSAPPFTSNLVIIDGSTGAVISVSPSASN